MKEGGFGMELWVAVLLIAVFTIGIILCVTKFRRYFSKTVLIILVSVFVIIIVLFILYVMLTVLFLIGIK